MKSIKVTTALLVSLVLSVASMSFATKTKAETFANPALVVNGLAYHSDRTTNYNERNFGLGLRASASQNWDVEAGYYNNSFHNRTVYVSASWLPLEYKSVKAGLFVLAATGYKDQTNMDVSPAGGLEASLNVIDRGAVVVRFIPAVPSVGEKPSAVTTVSFNVRF
jgi:hypothetical protein